MKLSSRDLVEDYKFIDINNLTELINSGGLKILEWTNDTVKMLQLELNQLKTVEDSFKLLL